MCRDEPESLILLPIYTHLSLIKVTEWAALGVWLVDDGDLTRHHILGSQRRFETNDPLTPCNESS